MKIRDQKVQRTLKKQKVSGLLQDKKVPGTNVGTRTQPQARPCGACCRTPGREPDLRPPPLPNRACAILSETWLPEVAGRGIRTKWKTQGDRRRWPRRVESWAEYDPDPNSPLPSWRGGLCGRSGPSLSGGSHRTEQEDFF